MCIGAPMQVVQAREFHAICQDDGRLIRVDTSLTGRPAVGSWLLVFLGAAREILDEQTALAMRDAVHAVAQVMSGDYRVDHLFDDLIERRPQVPEHLQHLIKES
jgi:hydrogenase expression/formation protein HypC